MYSFGVDGSNFDRMQTITLATMKVEIRSHAFKSQSLQTENQSHDVILDITSELEQLIQ